MGLSRTEPDARDRLKTKYIIAGNINHNTMIALIIISAILIPFLEGYLDGYFKRKSTVNHWIKWPFRAAMFYLVFTGLSVNQLIGLLLMYKPLFDIGYSRGQKIRSFIFIGTTDATDKFLHWIGAVYMEKNRFPIITVIYMALIFFGCCIIHMFRI